MDTQRYGRQNVRAFGISILALTLLKLVFAPPLRAQSPSDAYISINVEPSLLWFSTDVRSIALGPTHRSGSPKDIDPYDLIETLVLYSPTDTISLNDIDLRMVDPLKSILLHNEVLLIRRAFAPPYPDDIPALMQNYMIYFPDGTDIDAVIRIVEPLEGVVGVTHGVLDAELDTNRDTVSFPAFPPVESRGKP